MRNFEDYMAHVHEMIARLRGHAAHWTSAYVVAMIKGDRTKADEADQRRTRYEKAAAALERELWDTL